MYCTNCGKENDERNQFCLYCGTGLHAPSQDAKLAGKRPQKSPPTTKNRKLLIGFGAAIIGISILALVVYVVVAIGTSLFSTKEQLIYVIQEDRYEGFTALMTIRSDGKNNSELYSDRDGFHMGGFLPGLSNIFSPDGRTMAFPDSEGNLLLLELDGSAPHTLEGGNVYSSLLQGFSPKGDYFGYTSLGDQQPVLHVIDRQENEILFVEDMIFLGFLPNGNQAMAAEYDSSDYRLTTLGVIDISTGDYNYLAEINNYFDVGFPHSSPDGKTIYYWDETNLMEISTGGGSASSVYEAEYGGDATWIFFSPNEKTMAIIDGDAGELYLYEPDQGSKVRIDKDVNFDMADFYGDELVQFPASFSLDGKYLAYMVSESSGASELYIVKADGSNRVRLAKDAQSFAFAFSPDKRHIAYIKFDNDDEGGGLYIARLDGSESKRLDSGVWSFRFVDGGDEIVYSMVNGLASSNPESEIYRIRIDGKKKTKLLEADDGLYTFIWPLP